MAETRELLLASSSSSSSSSSSPSGSNDGDAQQMGRLFKRVTNETEFEQLFGRFGGYLPDVVRFALAQSATEEEDVVLSDRSRVFQLQQHLEQQLNELQLDPTSLLVLYRAMLETGKSPRAAMLLSEAVETLDVPEDVVVRLGALGLVDLRDSSPEVPDYVSLRSLRNEAHVCSVSPLSRFSMARIVKALEARAESRGGTGGVGRGSTAAAKVGIRTASNEL
jgi:hypothetical protein